MLRAFQISFQPWQFAPVWIKFTKVNIWLNLLLYEGLQGWAYEYPEGILWILLGTLGILGFSRIFSVLLGTLGKSTPMTIPGKGSDPHSDHAFSTYSINIWDAVIFFELPSVNYFLPTFISHQPSLGWSFTA